MRNFSSGEAAALLGSDDSYLRKLHLDGKGPTPELTPGNRRLYSAQDIRALRHLLEGNARKPGDYPPGRRDGDHVQIIGVMSFKGGSGKKTFAAHLAQRLTLTGYRVLAIDLDPQASLTALHGVQPEIDLLEGGTLYDPIRYDDPVCGDGCALRAQISENMARRDLSFIEAQELLSSGISGRKTKQEEDNKTGGTNKKKKGPAKTTLHETRFVSSTFKLVVSA
jgi:hypothetical protein